MYTVRVQMDLPQNTSSAVKHPHSLFSKTAEYQHIQQKQPAWLSHAGCCYRFPRKCLFFCVGAGGGHGRDTDCPLRGLGAFMEGLRPFHAPSPHRCAQTVNCSEGAREAGLGRRFAMTCRWEARCVAVGAGTRQRIWAQAALALLTASAIVPLLTASPTG